jgi:hypothetical protein
VSTKALVLHDTLPVVETAFVARAYLQVKPMVHKRLLLESQVYQKEKRCYLVGMLRMES